MTPIPLNIIPSPDFILSVFRKIISFMTTSVEVNEPTVIFINELNKREISTVSKSSDGDVVLRKHSTHGSQLNYKKVIERIVRRFLLNNNDREKEMVKEKDFDSFKQDLKSSRFEVMNDILKTRESWLEYTSVLQKGLGLLGQLFLGENSNSDTKNKFKNFKLSEQILQLEMNSMLNAKLKLSYEKN